MDLTGKQMKNIFIKNHTSKHDELSMIMDCEDFKLALEDAFKEDKKNIRECPNCKTSDVIEFLNRNLRQCQICEHRWKPY